MRIRTFAAAVAVAAVATIPMAGAASAQNTKNCEDFSSYAEVIASVRDGDPHNLDSDEDGSACEAYFNVPVGSESVVNEDNSSDSSDQVKTVPRGGVDTGDGTTTSAPMPITIVGAVAAAGIGGFAVRRSASSSR